MKKDEKKHELHDRSSQTSGGSVLSSQGVEVSAFAPAVADELSSSGNGNIPWLDDAPAAEEEEEKESRSPGGGAGGSNTGSIGPSIGGGGGRGGHGLSFPFCFW